jgi:adenine C2-methylase RlmN of 23S rRNA A2503 and tRNA A37
MGLKGNLCCGEIVEQLVHATRVTPIRNIVFMVGRAVQNAVTLILCVTHMHRHNQQRKQLDMQPA